MVAEKEPDALAEIQPILHDRRQVILDRIRKNDSNLRETFAALEAFEYPRSFDECVELATKALSQ